MSGYRTERVSIDRHWDTQGGGRKACCKLGRYWVTVDVPPTYEAGKQITLEQPEPGRWRLAEGSR